MRAWIAALGEALADGDGPVIVFLQAGNVHSGAFDAIAAAAALAHQHQVWVHTDGDCGIAIIAHSGAVRDAMGVHASYMVHAEGPGDPSDRVPESSRRTRALADGVGQRRTIAETRCGTSSRRAS